MSPDEPWCLVLSGGGAKGVYHIGAWRALKELGVPIGGFVGNSIGAVMAGFLASNRDAELGVLGQTMTLDALVTLPQRRGSLKTWWRSVVEHGGLDTGPMRALVAQNIDEAAIRASGRDLGLVTINVTDWKPKTLFLDDMPPGTLVDYVMASAAFPGFHAPVIDGKRYMDGGLWDNLPYDLARQRGWRRILLIDVSGIGWNRRPELEGGLTLYVKASIDMGGPFEFSPSFLSSFETLGYLDTLRAWGQLEGEYTFLEPDDALEGQWGPTLKRPERPVRRRVAWYLDRAAAALEVERIRAWTYRGLAQEIRLRRAQDDARVAQALAGSGTRPNDPRRETLRSPLVRALEGGVLEASPYRTRALIRSLSTGRTRAMLDGMLLALHPELAEEAPALALVDSLLLG